MKNVITLSRINIWLSSKRRVFVLVFVVLFFGELTACQGQGTDINTPWIPYPANTGTADMSPDKAHALYLAWKKWVGNLRNPSFDGIDLEDGGSFRAIYGALDFDYSFPDRRLIIMKSLSEGNTTISTYEMPGAKKNSELAQREPYTLGGNKFFINPKPWLDENTKARSPNVNAYTLAREFTGDSIPADRFVLDARWLVFWAEYWYPGGGGQPLPGTKESGSERAWRSPEEQAATRPDLEKWAKTILSKKAPPSVKAI